jgi:hypothetical protein
LFPAVEVRIGHARLQPKYRDGILSLILSRERGSYLYRMEQWRQAMVEAKVQHEWLLQIADLQAGRAHSPALEELRTFSFPSRPIRRVLVTPNDMRLLVLVGFALAAQDQRRISSGAVSSGITHVDSFPSVPDLPSGVADVLDERNISQLILHYHKVLNLPNISAHVLGNVWV